MIVLVTGASGALGRTLVPRLAAGGAHVEEMFHTAIPDGSGDGLIADLTDPRAIHHAVESVHPEVIVHLGAMVGRACDDAPALAQAVNVGGTATLLAAARSSGVRRFVFASTAAVYGTYPDGPIAESETLDLRTRYAATKRAAELTVRSASRDGLTSRILRIFNVWGAGFPSSLVGALDRSTASNPVLLHGLDGFVRDYVHADDVCDVFVSAVFDRASDRCLTANIGSGVRMSNRDLVNRMGIDRRRYRIGDDRVSSSVADISFARRTWAFAPSRLPGD